MPKPDAWDRWTAHRKTCTQCRSDIADGQFVPCDPCPDGLRLGNAMTRHFAAIPQSAQAADYIGPSIYTTGGCDESGDSDTTFGASQIGR